MFNTKYAKFYREDMDNNKDNIVNLIAYERKALRFLELGLKNPSVTHLLDSRPDQRKELENILPEIRDSLEFNVKRNKEIYKKPGTFLTILRNQGRRNSSTNLNPKKIHRRTNLTRKY